MAKFKKAFTIVELIIVIVVLGILITITMLSTNNIIAKGRDSQRSVNVKSLAEALEKYYEINGEYPGCLTMTSANLTTLSSKLYNLSQKSFTMPRNEKDTNAIVCADISTSDNDIISYKTSSSAVCQSSESCSYFILKYREESSGLIKTIKSRHSISTFAKTWGGTENDCAGAIANTSERGLAIVGCTYSYDSSGGDAFIAKYTNSGSLAWSRNWGGSAHDWATSITNTSDGGLAIAGGTYSYDEANGDAFIAKYTADGSLSWSRTWGSVDYDVAYSIIQTSDGGLAIAGRTTSFSAGGDSDAFVAKYTAKGTLSWAKTWGGTAYDGAFSMVQTSDGGIGIVGGTYSYGAGSEDGFIAKYAADGTLAWSKTWGGTVDECAGSIAQTTDGGLVITGCTNSFGAGGFDAYIAKYAADGTLAWSKTWGGVNDDFGNYIIQTSDGGFSMGGGTFSYGAGGEDAFIAKYTADGTLAWSKTWGGAGDDSAYSSVQTYDEGLAVEGRTTSYGAGKIDNFIIKYQPDGTIDGCDPYMCKEVIALESSPLAITNNQTVSETSPSAYLSSPAASSNSINPIETNLIRAIHAPTINFSSGEMRIEYPGEDLMTCKQWTAPTSKKIYGIYYYQETEEGYDDFIIKIDGAEIYNESGNYSNKYLDISSAPGTTIEACLSTDQSTQEGFGGEVTGVYYAE